MIKQFVIWIADLNPGVGTKTRKVRPVVILQTDLLNKTHPSTFICPITTNIQPDAEILRIHLPKGTANVKEACDTMIDQLRAIDNSRLLYKIGQLEEELWQKVKENVRIVLDLEN